KFMYEYFQTLGIEQKFQVIPVPLHKKRQKQRHYNHMFLVAEEFCKLTGFELNYNLIKRVKDTKPQYKLSKAERVQNLANAFEVFPEYNLNLPVLLIDDICTSGATFESIINSLHSKSITEITCFATTTPIF
ncbi:MAG: ComF family protein, partial [Candidatus Gastranaerophilaceae bacterium]